MIRILALAFVLLAALAFVRFLLLRRRPGAFGLEILFSLGAFLFFGFGVIVLKFVITAIPELLVGRSPAQSDYSLPFAGLFAGLAGAGFFLARWALRRLKTS